MLSNKGPSGTNNQGAVVNATKEYYFAAA